MDKGIIYYTDNRVREPIFSTVQEYILKADLPIVSTSLKKIDFGENIVVKGERSYPQMIDQIVTALEFSTSSSVFFCEHDVLYHPSHFDFTPEREDIFYYNENVWRWKFESDTAVRYDRMLPLSVLCVNREFALKHYKMRQAKIRENIEDLKSHEPALARKWGYEPGTKSISRGGLTDDEFQTWRSEYPNIDIRHSRTFSPPKVALDSFKHKPENWQEILMEEIPGWNLKELFDL